MALKVVGAGFGRTGTLSLKSALDKLERRSSQIFARPDAWRDIAQVRVAGDDAALLGAV